MNELEKLSITEAKASYDFIKIMIKDYEDKIGKNNFDSDLQHYKKIESALYDYLYSKVGDLMQMT